MSENNKNLNKIKKAAEIFLVLLFWLVVWQVSVSIANENLLIAIPTPLSVAKELIINLKNVEFLLTILFSLLRIVFGFLLAVVVGTLFAAVCSKVKFIKLLFSPLLSLIRAVPVAAFIILVFLWVEKGRIPTFISFLTVLPIVFANVEAGISQTDVKLLEMSKVMGMSKFSVLKEIYLPSVKPYFSSATVTGLGFAFKSGVAAEVICRTQDSLGNLLWASKNIIDYDNVFAVTAVIIALSLLLEFLAKSLMKGGRNAK